MDVQISVKIPVGQLAVLTAYSAMKQQSVSELVQESVDLLIDQIVYDDWTKIRELMERFETRTNSSGDPSFERALDQVNDTLSQQLGGHA